MRSARSLQWGAQGLLLYVDDLHRQFPVVVPCSFVGLGGFQRATVDDDGAEDIKEVSQIARAIGVGLPETLSGLLLQPSLFALSSAHTAGQYKQLLSLAVSWAMALKAAVELALTIVKNWRKLEQSTYHLVLFVVFFGLSVLVTICVGMLRVFCAYQCEDHVWNLFIGCVEL